ncbi:MAG: hypothetical protein KJ850_11205 [Gammaproteobacteria bacterium]|nr:hypothetical protein [Gammaproteobacteria bacterium]MBU1625597.1 hypothetical protein [Gammaproteobacteria bacterium]MBU1980857.1 hypothetical protein [Gammaproteobacteria bacterium]
MSHSNTPANRIERGWEAFGWLTLAVLLAYANALFAVFQFDDYKVIVYQEGVHSWRTWLAGLGHGIRALLKASYTLDWTLSWGATGFHLSNLLIHLVTCWLVYLLSQHFISRHERLRPISSLAILIALLFALHPANTEAVTYISGRSTSLMSLFYLAGLLSYTQGRLQKNRLWLHVMTPLCFAAALLTKETAVTFPFALLLWERFAIKPEPAMYARQWSSWLLLLFAALFFLFSDSYQSQMLRSANFNTVDGNFATQLAGALWLLKQWLFPFWLNIDPDHPIYHKLLDAPLSLGISLLLLATSWRARRTRPWLSFALVWALLQLMPLYLLLPRMDVANERQLYLAAWPLCLALCIEIAIRFQRIPFLSVLITLLFACSLLTIQRNQDYRSEIALWEDTVQKSPGKARVHNNLGHAYLLDGRDEDARQEFESALRIDPQHAEAFANLQKLKNKKAGAMPRP